MIDPAARDRRRRSPVHPLLIGVGLALAGLVIALLVSRGSQGTVAEPHAGEATSTESARRDSAFPMTIGGDDASRTPVESAAATSPGSGESDARSGIRLGGELTGRVLDPAGRPVAGCAVELRRGVASEFTVLDLVGANSIEKLSEVRTDPSGEFGFELARGTPVDVAASRAGFVEQVLPNRYAGEFVEIVLSSGYLVHGQVTRALDGSPVEGATVRVFQLGGSSARVIETVTAADGRYELRFAFREQVTLHVLPRSDQSSDFIPLEVLDQPTIIKNVVLEAGLLLEGHVTDARNGAPIQGALLGEGWNYSRSVTTDANGEYRFPGFGAPGLGELFARAEGYGGAQRSHLPGAENGRLRVDFQLQPGHLARGRILEPTGLPIAGAYVAAVASQYGSEGQEAEWRSAISEADGRFLIADLTPGLRHALFVKKHGWGTRVYDFPDSELVEPEVDFGNVTLSPPGLLVGQVVDEQERGIADVHISLRGTNEDRSRFGKGHDLGDFYVSSRNGRSDSRGYFSFGDLATGSYRLQVRSQGWADSAPIQVHVREGSVLDGLVLRMAAGDTIRGRAIDELGLPVREVEVWAHQTSAEGEAGARSTSASARTDAEGLFELRGLAPGGYRLVVYPFWIAESDPEAPWLSTRIESVRTGTDELEIVMERGQPIRGQLLDALGRPLPDHWIRPAGEVRTSGALVETDLEGRFELAVSRDSLCDLEVLRSDEDSDGQPVHTERGIPAGALDVRLQLSE